MDVQSQALSQLQSHHHHQQLLQRQCGRNHSDHASSTKQNVLYRQENVFIILHSQAKDKSEQDGLFQVSFSFNQTLASTNGRTID